MLRRNRVAEVAYDAMVPSLYLCGASRELRVCSGQPPGPHVISSTRQADEFCALLVPRSNIAIRVYNNKPKSYTVLYD